MPGRIRAATLEASRPPHWPGSGAIHGPLVDEQPDRWGFAPEPGNGAGPMPRASAAGGIRPAWAHSGTFRCAPRPTARASRVGRACRSQDQGRHLRRHASAREWASIRRRSTVSPTLSIHVSTQSNWRLWARSRHRLEHRRARADDEHREQAGDRQPMQHERVCRGILFGADLIRRSATTPAPTRARSFIRSSPIPPAP